MKKFIIDPMDLSVEEIDDLIATRKRYHQRPYTLSGRMCT